MPTFTTVKVIGRGGFGIVEEVIDGQGVRFAKKTFSPAAYIGIEHHERLKGRFKREVLTQQQLGGTEIMPVLFSDLACARPWFVMPLASSTYDSKIEEDKRSGSVDINAIADILNGLQYLHNLGYVHRDLNPKNILLHEGHWKLSDLGAILPPSGQTVTLTEHTIIYTEQYCSPEQRKDFHKAQSFADVYSFGCILHDIFGNPPRNPFSTHTADGPIGLIIEKCTLLVPNKRPTVKILRNMLLETLVEVGGHCKVVDDQAEAWLERLSKINQWKDSDYDDFARFFAGIDVNEKAPGFEHDYVHTLSAPFLTRLSAEALGNIAMRSDGTGDAIIEKYCDWAKSTSFQFHYADTVCACLVAICDKGSAANRATEIVALIKLGFSHNRWYIMREMLQRCGKDVLAGDKGAERRISIEIKIEQVEDIFRSCIQSVAWDKGSLAPDIMRIATEG